MTPSARRLRRPVTVLVALFLGLGVVGTAAGTALGAVGAASATHADGPRDHGPGHGFRPGR